MNRKRVSYLCCALDSSSRLLKLIWSAREVLRGWRWHVELNELESETREDMKRFKAELQSRSQPKSRRRERLDQFDIDRARDYPGEQLLEIDSRGMATCLNPEHEDRHPSMRVGGKFNIAKCYVCDQRWDAIDVVRLTRGLGFVDAVKWLNAR